MGEPDNALQREIGSSGRRDLPGWTGLILGGLSGVLMVLVLAGLVYQGVASKRERERHPPPGELVNVGGYRLHIYCTGQKQSADSPTVVLEAGQGNNWLDWSPVQDRIAAFARVCAYDRAGLGWSDALSAPVPSSRVAESLHTLLHNHGVEGPYVLVGHSLGGIYVRAFANHAPEEVAAIALIDSSHENQWDRFPREFIELEDPEAWLLPVCRAAAPFGLVRLARAMDVYAAEMADAPGEAAIRLATMNRTPYCRTLMNEQASLIMAAGQPAPPPGLGDIPLAVLSAGVDWFSRDLGELLPGATTELLQQAYTVWLELHRELAALSSESTHIIAEKGGHYIHHDQPDLVVDVIRRMVESAQSEMALENP